MWVIEAIKVYHARGPSEIGFFVFPTAKISVNPQDDLLMQSKVDKKDRPRHCGARIYGNPF